MPKNWNIFKDEFDKYTKVSDYISGMTDKFAINTHSKFFELYSKKCYCFYKITRCF